MLEFLAVARQYDHGVLRPGLVQLQQTVPDVSERTLYRILDTLVQARWISRVQRGSTERYRGVQDGLGALACEFVLIIPAALITVSPKRSSSRSRKDSLRARARPSYPQEGTHPVHSSNANRFKEPLRGTHSQGPLSPAQKRPEQGTPGPHGHGQIVRYPAPAPTGSAPSRPCRRSYPTYGGSPTAGYGRCCDPGIRPAGPITTCTTPWITPPAAPRTASGATVTGSVTSQAGSAPGWPWWQASDPATGEITDQPVSSPPLDGSQRPSTSGGTSGPGWRLCSPRVRFSIAQPRLPPALPPGRPSRKSFPATVAVG